MGHTPHYTLEQNYPIPGAHRGNPTSPHPWVQANALRFTAANSSSTSQAFNWIDLTNTLHTFNYDTFVSKLRTHLAALALDPKLYASHSFRRGGASFAYQSGVPIELIKALGDWRSDAVLIYLTMPLHIRLHSANLLSKAVLKHNSNSQ